MASKPARVTRTSTRVIWVVCIALIVLLFALPFIAQKITTTPKETVTPSSERASDIDTGMNSLGASINAVTASDDDNEATDGAGDCKVKYYALSNNKEVPYAIGTRVKADNRKEMEKELKERRTCGKNDARDTETTVTHYAGWSNARIPHGKTVQLTAIRVDFGNIDAFRARLNADTELYDSVVKELEALEGESKFKIEKVKAGTWSLYAKPHSNGTLTTHIGTTGSDGTAATYTHPSGAVVQYRLECGFQILRYSPPKGIDKCTYDNCNPTKPPKPTCPPGHYGTPPNCHVSKKPSDSVTAPQGTNDNGGSGGTTKRPGGKTDPLDPDKPITADPGGDDPDNGGQEGVNDPDNGTPGTDPDN